MSEASATDRAYEAIREGILTGAYPTDAMLGEASLAAEIGVSRTPVRVALSRLQDEGWVVTYPKRGILVKGMTDKAIEDLAEARLMMEASSVRHLGAERRERLAESATASIAQQRVALAAGDIRGFIELTIAFHRGFIEASRNSVLLELSDRVGDRQRFLLFSHGADMLARWPEIIAEHEHLVALLDRPDEFEDALRIHLGETHSLEISRDDD